MNSSRPNKNREFFKCTIPNAIDLIRQLAGNSIEYEKVNYESPEEIEKIRLEREREKRNAERQRKEKEKQIKYQQFRENKSKNILSKIDNDNVELDLKYLYTKSDSETWMVWIIAFFLLPIIGLVIGIGIIAFILVGLGIWWWWAGEIRDDRKTSQVGPLAKEEVDQLYKRLMEERDWVNSYDAQLQITIRNFKSRASKITKSKNI